MAATVTAPNLERFILPEVEISYESNGIISIIDDLVERVMSVHMKKNSVAASEATSAEDDLVTLLGLHSVYDFSPEEEAAA
jgi:hypothetical protein